MRRIALPALFTLCALAPAAGACSFCSGGLANRTPLREQFTKAAVVALGELSDARIDADGTNGRTVFTPARVLKGTLTPGRPVVLGRYLPPPPGKAFLLFANAPPIDPAAPVVPVFGVFASPGVADYVTAAAKVPANVPARLGFAFARLADPDPEVRADAFLEFAQASDADIATARTVLKPDALRKLMADPGTPTEHHGVFAVLLGLVARPEDADYLHALVTAKEPPQAVRDNLGAYLSALTLAAPPRGWPIVRAVVVDVKRPYSERLSAIGAVRYLYSTRPALRPDAVACHRALLGSADLADIAADDLRRWGRKDALPDVLAQASKPTHAGRLVRRAFVRFALACPDPDAKAFVARVRAADPKLVAGVESIPADPPAP